MRGSQQTGDNLIGHLVLDDTGEIIPCEEVITALFLDLENEGEIACSTSSEKPVRANV
jgi:hypothetical protein